MLPLSHNSLSLTVSLTSCCLVQVEFADVIILNKCDLAAASKSVTLPAALSHLPPSPPPGVTQPQPPQLAQQPHAQQPEAQQPPEPLGPQQPQQLQPGGAAAAAALAVVRALNRGARVLHSVRCEVPLGEVLETGR